MVKTNKSFSKRLKVTKTGKVLSRKIGQNHFNAKERRRKQLAKKNPVEITRMSNKDKDRFLPKTK